MAEFHLPAGETVAVTPELIARLAEELPDHEEGEYSFTMETKDLQAFMEEAGHTVIRGYQNWGALREAREGLFDE